MNFSNAVPDTRDALTLLPHSRVTECSKGYTIYAPARPAEQLHLVVSGRVKVFSTAHDGTQLLLRIVPSEGLFGQCALLPPHLARSQSAVALETVQLMSWSAEDIERRVESEPKLALALFEYFAADNCLLQNRVSHFASFTTGPRVIIALLQLAGEIGARRPDGALRLTGLTHQAIAEYVGTSREIVTSEMNRLRRLGYVSYSRRYLDVFADALTEWQRQEAAVSQPGPYTAELGSIA